MTAKDTETKELVVAEKLSAPKLFKKDSEDLTKLLSKIEKKATIVIDATTKKGRDEIASLGYKVARSKTIIDDLGKKHLEELKVKVREGDGERKRARDFLDTLKNTVLEPKIKWEEKEQKRVDVIKNKISCFMPRFIFDPAVGIHSADISQKIGILKDVVIDEEGFAEFRGEAAIEKDRVLRHLEEQLTAAKKREDERAELERLRKEDEARRKADIEKLSDAPVLVDHALPDTDISVVPDQVPGKRLNFFDTSGAAPMATGTNGISLREKIKKDIVNYLSKIVTLEEAIIIADDLYSESVPHVKIVY